MLFNYPFLERENRNLEKKFVLAASMDSICPAEDGGRPIFGMIVQEDTKACQFLTFF